MELGISRLESRSPAQAPFEMVERKGVGHPDTICDALAEAFSRALSAHYVERFGAILHHNVDKALLVAGASRPAFGGGDMVAPIDIYLAGRAVTEYRGVRIPVEDIAVEASRRWLREHLHALDADRDVRLHVLVRPASSDLQGLFAESGTLRANDTSLAAGYAPLDELERVVLAAGRRLGEPATTTRYPAIGEDTKVMGVRRGSGVRLTVACALVGRHVANLDEYFAVKRQVAALVHATARDITTLPLEIEVNAADGATPGSLYVTVTGTSAEAGDDGQVGRGNRVNGLITPYRPMTLEAAAGKNALTHVGKLYNIAAQRVAASLARSLPGVEEAYCYLVSRIGQPVAAPSVVDVRLRLAPDRRLRALHSHVETLVRDELADMETYWKRVCAGEMPLW